MKVIVTKIGITHYQATCTSCGFEEVNHADTEYVLKRVYKHVQKTGHKVIIEKTVATHYGTERTK